MVTQRKGVKVFKKFFYVLMHKTGHKITTQAEHPTTILPVSPFSIK